MNEIELLQTIKELRKQKKRWYDKIYRFENREKSKEQNKKYKFENKEKIKESNKIYYKKYRNTYNGYKVFKILDWKRLGVIDNDFDKLFEKYMNTKNCENCDCLLTRDKRNTSTTKCLDHCHISGKFRNILCHACNVRRGI